MSNSRLLFYTLFFATVFWFYSDVVRAETDVASCLEAPNSACFDPLNTGLDAIESGMSDPDAEGLAKLKRATALAASGKLDLAQEVVDAMPDSASNRGFRDSAILAMLSAVQSEPQVSGRNFLSQITAPEYYETARGIYIANLLRMADLDTVMQEMVDTNQPNQPMKYVAVRELSEALADAGRLREAVQLIGRSAPNDDGMKDMQLETLVSNLLYRGSVANAGKVLAEINDPYWQIIAKSGVARALATDGNMADAEVLFHEAEAAIAGIAEPKRRLRAFQSFAHVALAGGRADLAGQMAEKASTTAADHAHLLTVILGIGSKRLKETELHSITETAISLLQKNADSSAALPDHNYGWGNLATKVAMAGDLSLAVSLIQRISDETWRQQALKDVISSLAYNSHFQDALDLLPLQKNGDMQVQGYLLISQLAKSAGQKAMAEKSFSVAVGLVEGPEFVTVNEATVGKLAQYESAIGEYDVAERRLRHLTDEDIRTRGRIVNFGLAAEKGSQGDYDTYLNIARDAVGAIDSPDLQRRLLQRLALTLVHAGKAETLPELALTIKADSERDKFLLTMTVIMTNYQMLVPIRELIPEFADPAQRALAEHELLLAALRASLASERPGPVKYQAF